MMKCAKLFSLGFGEDQTKKHFILLFHVSAYEIHLVNTNM